MVFNSLGSIHSAQRLAVPFQSLVNLLREYSLKTFSDFRKPRQAEI